jgi:hypothetical protein
VAQIKEAWEKPRMSRGFIVSLILIAVVACACRLIFWDDWRAVKRNPISRGYEESAWSYAARCLNKRCRLYGSDYSATYDEAGKAWEFKGHCDHLGGPAKFTCRVYFGADCEYHLESCWFGWP